jgi:hypothetical protein
VDFPALKQGKLSSMPRKVAVSCPLILLVFLSLTGVTFAVIEVETFHYERPIRVLRGRVTGFGQVVPGFWVDVFKKARESPDRLNPQDEVASAEPDSNGEFNFKSLPNGVYEVEFGNRGRGGYNTVALIVEINPRGAKDRLCVDVGLESAAPKSSVRRCTSK